MNMRFYKTDIFRPFMHLEPEVLKCFFPFFRLDKVLYLHLLKFAEAENKIARSYFIAKRLADLGEAEWKLGMECIKHVLKIHKHALRGFGSQVRNSWIVHISSNRSL